MLNYGLVLLTFFNMKKSTVILVIILVILIAGAVYYWYMQQSAGLQPTPSQPIVTQETVTPMPVTSTATLTVLPPGTVSTQATTEITTQATTQTTTPAITETQTTPATLAYATSRTLGNYIIAINGMTLYSFKNDTAGVSNCSGTCATIWPPYIVKSAAGLTANAILTGTLGTITRTDGTLQATYNGMPLYFYSKDSKAGDTTGNGFNNLWSVVIP